MYVHSRTKKKRSLYLKICLLLFFAYKSASKGLAQAKGIELLFWNVNKLKLILVNKVIYEKGQENVGNQQSPQVFLQFLWTWGFLWQCFLFLLHLLPFHIFLHEGGAMVVVVVIGHLMSSVTPKNMHEKEVLIECFICYFYVFHSPVEILTL